MKTMIFLALVVVLFMVTGCTGKGNSAKVKTGCVSLVKMVR